LAIATKSAVGISCRGHVDAQFIEDHALIDFTAACIGISWGAYFDIGAIACALAHHGFGAFAIVIAALCAKSNFFIGIGKST
jgi:hypothetical protein